MDHWLCCSAQGAQQAWAPPRPIPEPHMAPAAPEPGAQQEKMALQSYQQCCSLLLSLSSGYRRGEGASHPKNPRADCFPSTRSRCQLGQGTALESAEQGDGSQLGGPASKTITQNGQNSSLHPSALMWSQLQNPPN